MLTLIDGIYQTANFRGCKDHLMEKMHKEIILILHIKSFVFWWLLEYEIILYFCCHIWPNLHETYGTEASP